MSKTRQALGAELQATMFETLDDEAFERLEEALIYADVGAPTTAKIVERLEAEAPGDRRGAHEPRCGSCSPRPRPWRATRSTSPTGPR